MILTPAHLTEIRHIVRSCGQQAKTLSVQNYEIFQKEPGDFVTTVDQTLDRQLSEFFANLFPDDGVITEENAASRKHYQVDYPRFWCIDPLDGTQDFIHGDPDYAVMVGLLENQIPIAGWIYAPEKDALYYGGKALGVWQALGDGAPELCEIPAARVNSFRVIIGDKDFKNTAAKISASIPEIDFLRSPGSFGLKVMNVVLGKAEVYLYLNRRVKLWDTVSPIAIAQAAGLMCCDLEGNQIQFTPEVLDLESLAHRQAIVIGQADVVEALLPRLRAVLDPQLSL
ncbi:MAG: inositol monophosphatase family protein [Phormidium tanganyikae FI6-MK23]|jgi:3'(2'), 5'-bisphosphate nucleotidase|nr:inositol monophosphatase family protein [Phormidium tanganyikae FI6-MK23]